MPELIDRPAEIVDAVGFDGRVKLLSKVIGQWDLTDLERAVLFDARMGRR